LTQVEVVVELIHQYEGDELRVVLEKWIEDSSAARWVPISVLKPWANNPRNNDGRPVEAVAESISRFGFASPLLARLANGEIIAGHTRLKAAKLLGLKKVPVRYLDITEEEAHLLALADNKIGELADWKNDILAGILAELDADDLAVAGFDDDDLGSLLEEEIGADSEIVPESWSVIVECEDEEGQCRVMEYLEEGGFQCRALIS
jgi:ParB-like chromosome segregation protein Spo0J